MLVWWPTIHQPGVERSSTISRDYEKNQKKSGFWKKLWLQSLQRFLKVWTSVRKKNINFDSKYHEQISLDDTTISFTVQWFSGDPWISTSGDGSPDPTRRARNNLSWFSAENSTPKERTNHLLCADWTLDAFVRFSCPSFRACFSLFVILRNVCYVK